MLGLAEQRADDLLPPVLEGQRGLDLVEGLVAVQAGAAGRGFDLVGREVHVRRRRREALTGEHLQEARGPDALAELPGRLLGEGDGDDRGDGRAAVHQRHDALDHLAGLAAAGAGLHEHGGPELVADGLAGVLVDELDLQGFWGHRVSSWVSSTRWGPSSGAS